VYSKVIKTLNGLDSRYPTKEEEQTILGWASSLPRRLQVADLVQKHEERLVSESIEEMKRRYPRFHPLHDRGWEKSNRDMQLVLRYAVQGMVADDADMPRDKLFAWLCTIIKGMGMTTQFSRDSYVILTERLRKHLPADAFATLEPYMARVTEDMSTYLEPSRPAVG